MFTKTVKEAKVSGISADISGLDSGEYSGMSCDGREKAKQRRERDLQFTLVAQGKAQTMVLESTAPSYTDTWRRSWAGRNPELR